MDATSHANRAGAHLIARGIWAALHQGAGAHDIRIRQLLLPVASCWLSECTHRPTRCDMTVPSCMGGCSVLFPEHKELPTE
eukprot:1236204-Alexandrium_andersonii.AAC.1